MTNSTGTSIPPAWYADPADASQLRWWDGAAWTARVASRPVAVPAVTIAPRAVQIPQLPQRRGWAPAPIKALQAKQSAQTIPGWFLGTALLWISIPANFIGLYINTAYPQIAPIAVVIAAYLIMGWLAWLDGNVLESRGYDRTGFGWILLPPVYFMIRTVRVGWRGAAVGIVHLATLGIVAWLAEAQLLALFDIR